MGIFPYASTPERKKLYLFSDNIFNTKTSFFYIKGKKKYEFNTLEDLKKYKIIGVLGYFYKDLFDSAGIKADYSPHEINAIKRLLAGRYDLYPGTVEVTWNLIEDQLPYDIDKFAILPVPLAESENSLVFSKENKLAEKYLTKFNNGLEKLKKSGRYEELKLLHNIR